MQLHAVSALLSDHLFILMLNIRLGDESHEFSTISQDCLCRLWPLFMGRNSSVSSVLGSLTCVIQRRGFDPPLNLRQRGFFPWSSHGFWIRSLKNLLDEKTNLGLVCKHMHSIAWTQKILTFMSKTGECLQQTHTQQCIIHEDGMRLPLWLDFFLNGHMRKDLTKNGETVRSTWDRRRRGRRRPLLEKGIREQAISVLPACILT